MMMIVRMKLRMRMIDNGDDEAAINNEDNWFFTILNVFFLS